MSFHLIILLYTNGVIQTTPVVERVMCYKYKVQRRGRVREEYKKEKERKKENSVHVPNKKCTN